jgi:glycine/D-amino acid oxidase-like deaminating enzyme
MTLPKTADVVIIGGGIMGVSIAYYLARRSAGRILVLEREVLGSGSTGRSVASVDLFSPQPAVARLQQHAYEIFAHFSELFGDDCGFVTTGCAVLAGSDQAADLQKAFAVTQAAGIDVRLLRPAEFADLEPAANVDDLASVCYMPAGGYADPVLTLNATVAAARRAGVMIQQGRPVTGLVQQGGRITGVETNEGTIAAPVVVCAAGPWSGRLLQAFGLAGLGLSAARHPVIAMQGVANVDPPRLSILDLPHGTYARPETGGLTLAGSLDPAVGYDPVEPDDQQEPVTPDYTFWVAERLVQRYPMLETAELRPGWSGLMSISPDWQPVLGRLPEVTGLYCAAGFSGGGFKISPAVGDLMAGLMTGETEATQLLAPFRPARFAENEPLATSGVVALG